jgi:hypothetical protein
LHPEASTRATISSAGSSATVRRKWGMQEFANCVSTAKRIYLRIAAMLKQ